MLHNLPMEMPQCFYERFPMLEPMLAAVFSQTKTSMFSGKHHFQAIEKYNILATAKVRVRQSCTKLCRVETWILCFPPFN
jgi:hypothetical protein